MEIVSSIIYQLTRCLTPEQIKSAGFETYFVDHTTGVYPQAASGVPFSAATLQVTGDALADLFEDLAAEQKARLTYDNILRLVDDPEVKDPIRFLRAREIVHFQRFGESLRIVQDGLDCKNFYAFNPSFDKCCNPPDVVCTPKHTNMPTPCTAPSACGCGTVSDCGPLHCGCHTPMPLPSCECVPAKPAMPSCGCQTPVPMPLPSCGCTTVKPAMPSCGCQAPAPMPLPSCGCATVKPAMPSCGCQAPAPMPLPSCGCAPQQPVCPVAPAVPSCGCGCPPVATPYAAPSPKMGTKSCGCG